MLKTYITILLAAISISLMAQAIDGSFLHETDPAKEYSIYVPSNYDPAIPNSLMLGLHPLNTNRWDAKSWRDTLIVFAEANDLLLVCPDGGPDGKIDDSIDTSFTSVLLDSVSLWYNIDEEEKYLMGFSWGGKTTYSYGLRRTDNFKGYLVIGAAVTLNEVADVMPNANKVSFYLLHGSNDTPNVRFEPMLQALEAVDACVNSLLMPGVGHTIDFPNRNQLLSDAFNWLKNEDCKSSATIQLDNSINIFPNPTPASVNIEGIDLKGKQIYLTDLSGKALDFSLRPNGILINSSHRGSVILRIVANKETIIKRILKF